MEAGAWPKGKAELDPRRVWMSYRESPFFFFSLELRGPKNRTWTAFATTYYGMGSFANCLRQYNG
jgi:hypothetical protein